MAPPDCIPPLLTERPRAFSPYWIRADKPVAAVSDPPCSGVQVALLMKGPRGLARVLDHVTCKVYDIPPDCTELRAGYEMSDAMTSKILDKLSEPRSGLGGGGDYELVADVLDAAGRPDTASAWRDFARASRVAADAGVGGNPDGRPATSGSGFLPGGVKAGSRLGQVVEFFLGRLGTVTDCMKALGMERNGVLSHLWGAAKKHGYTYTLDKGTDSCELVPPS
jgi:hypothetical protein